LHGTGVEGWKGEVPKGEEKLKVKRSQRVKAEKGRREDAAGLRLLGNIDPSKPLSDTSSGHRAKKPMSHQGAGVKQGARR